MRPSHLFHLENLRCTRGAIAPTLCEASSWNVSHSARTEESGNFGHSSVCSGGSQTAAFCGMDSDAHDRLRSDTGKLTACSIRAYGVSRAQQAPLSQHSSWL